MSNFERQHDQELKSKIRAHTPFLCAHNFNIISILHNKKILHSIVWHYIFHFELWILDILFHSLRQFRNEERRRKTWKRKKFSEINKLYWKALPEMKYNWTPRTSLIHTWAHLNGFISFLKFHTNSSGEHFSSGIIAPTHNNNKNTIEIKQSSFHMFSFLIEISSRKWMKKVSASAFPFITFCLHVKRFCYGWHWVQKSIVQTYLMRYKNVFVSRANS